MPKKKIVFTGGGSAGHVTPNIALINELDNWDRYYIGSKKGIEKELIEKINIPYFGINSGKLRRYIDFENFVDVFRVLKGCFEARRVLKKIKPDLVFSKGGFVSVPVIIGAKTLGIPIYIHESDMTPAWRIKSHKDLRRGYLLPLKKQKSSFRKIRQLILVHPLGKKY